MHYTRFPLKARGQAAGGERQDPPPSAPPSAPPQETAPAGTVAAASVDLPTPAAVERLTRLPAILMLSIVTPIILNLGGLSLNPSRLVLVLVFLPVFGFWASGKAGQIRTADIMVLLCAIWTIIAMLAVEGMGRLQYASVVAIEMLCPYLIARYAIRSEAQYAALIRFLRWIAIFLAPAAIVEALTTKRPYVMLLDPVFKVFGKADYEFRFGMSRAQVVFEHPILYGVYVATFCAPVYMLARAQGRSPLMALIFVAPVLVATFFSLSTGAYLGLILQMLLIGWGFMMRKVPSRWTIITTLALIAYIIVDLISNRSPFEVFISYLTFNSSTSYARVLIFEYGIQNVWARPLFGMGLKDWDRPEWMFHSSVDNFWLLMAMRYGIPGFVFIAVAFAAVIAAMTRARPASPAARLYRDGHVFSLVGLIISICTVHLWGATFVFMMFMLGAGMWVANAPRAPDKPGRPLTPGGTVPPDGVSGATTGSGPTRRPGPRPPAARP